MVHEGERIVARIVEKPSSIRDLGAVDVSRVLPALEKLPERLWEHEDSIKDNAFACFHQTQHILFRFVHRDDEPQNYETKPLWQVWQGLLLPVIQQAIRPYGFIEPLFPKAMFARLVAHGRINRHRDGPGTNLRTHKIHVPLRTNPLALLEAGGIERHLECGQAYEVNNIGPHAVRNDGDTDRVHFIFEVFEGAHDCATVQPMASAVAG